MRVPSNLGESQTDNRSSFNLRRITILLRPVLIVGCSSKFVKGILLLKSQGQKQLISTTLSAWHVQSQATHHACH